MQKKQSFEGLLNAANLPILEEFYQNYLENPDSVPSGWMDFFNSLNNTGDAQSQLSTSANLDDDIPMVATTDLHMKVIGLMQTYRRHGHYSADNNPLYNNANQKEQLLNANKLFSAEEKKQLVEVFFAGQKQRFSIDEIIEKMEKTYCGSIGTEFYYIREDDRRRWLIENIESRQHHAELNRNIKKMIFEKLNDAESFERFLATRYPGKKRFSLEGGESLIPTLSAIVENAGTYKIDQLVIGMAHRGRLNVLTNVMGKSPAAIFAEFNEKTKTSEKDGDVKYHMGFSSDVESLTGGIVHLTLGFNPSHLEVINPVILGSTRARQTYSNDTERVKNLPVIIHGDAAFAGQGINYECLNMADLDGYTVGGTLHIIVNNQIGFTTDPRDSRSTSYCTGLAKILQAPIFHVNGDDPEACYKAIVLCLKWRQQFKTDVFLDLICYRRWGHNETDEPSFTQPLMYKKIKSMPSVTSIYATKLLSAGFEKAEIDAIQEKRVLDLESCYQKVETENMHIQRESLQAQWEGFKKDSRKDPLTKVSEEKLVEWGTQINQIPQEFSANPKIQRLFKNRLSMFDKQRTPLDWGAAEMLAYASILMEGNHIRLTGQDVQRGTFSHRHAILFDSKTGKPYSALQGIHPDSRIEIINSLLSEMGALGFEFGYSLADPRTLVIWEAQFGDFVNNAQVIIDQFITSCEAKWHRMSGLVMLLPHGYEGQGPEHSSARLERFLQLCSQNNIQVCVPTTPAQFFHMIRRQILRDVRKPLIVMSPKSLLRHPKASSSLNELSNGKFLNVIDDPAEGIDAPKVTRILLCSGKIYYDLAAHRDDNKLNHIAIIRIEMLYPYPEKDIAHILQKYENAKTICWVQDEPRNQGAWIYMETRLGNQLDKSSSVYYIGRDPSASTATGYFKVHTKQQEKIIAESMGPDEDLKNKIKFNQG